MKKYIAPNFELNLLPIYDVLFLSGEDDNDNTLITDEYGIGNN